MSKHDHQNGFAILTALNGTPGGTETAAAAFLYPSRVAKTTIADDGPPL
jgi:hypothetical protein